MICKKAPNLGLRIILQAACCGLALLCFAGPGYGNVSNYVGCSYSNINKLPAGSIGSNMLNAQLVPDTTVSRLKFITPSRIIIVGSPSGIMFGNSITVEAQNALGNRDASFSGTVTLSSSSGTGRFSRNGVTWSTLSDSVFTMQAGSVSFYFKDFVENSPTISALHASLIPASQIEGVLIDSTAPQGAVSINSGALFANRKNVTLNLSAADTMVSVDLIVISNSPAFETSNTVAYSASAPWTLSGAEETNTVHVKFIDRVGNVSAVFSDSIYVDLTAPVTGSVSIITDTYSIYAYSRNVVLSLSASDTLTSIDTMVISNYADFSASSTVAYANTASWTLLTGDGTRTVYVKFMDKAGNLSAVYSDNIMQVMGTISGAVFKDTDPYDTYTYLQPIAAVVIDIMKNTEIIATAATYSDGTFGFMDLNSGTYSVVATWIANDIVSSVSSDIRTGTLGLTYTLSIKYKLGEISGLVAGVKARVTPFKFGCKVFSAESDGIVELSQRGRVVIRVPVDAIGRYSIPNLLPGTFTARAFNGYIWSNTVRVTLREGQLLNLNFTFEVLPETLVKSYPNPVKNGSATIEFYCDYTAADLEIRIFTLDGEVVKTFVWLYGGVSGTIHTKVWNCDNELTEKVASGVYLYQVVATDKLTSQRKSVVKKLMIIR